MLFVCAAFCTEEEEQLKKEIEKEQKEKTQHEQNLRMLEAEKRQLADVLAVKEKAVEESTGAKQKIRDKLFHIARQNEEDRRKLKQYKRQSQQERLDTSQLLQQMDAARKELEEIERASENIKAVAAAFHDAKADLAAALENERPPAVSTHSIN